ncbi:MAG: sugar transferase, partial [Eubacteriales bacterium]|nr:sugar transferase [Eubacteriales bacterium]
LLSPAFLIIPIFIRMESKGKAIYSQERYTRDKKVFKLHKFRTMYIDAEKYGAQLSTKDDPRITKVGNVLRKHRLDELPQLFNILLGDMSIVGPRPERPVFADEFSQKVRHYDLRYTIKAGLTGYAQVYGKYNTRVSDKILLDLIYAGRFSLWLDIKLIVLTIRTMFTKDSTEGIDEILENEYNSPERELERRNYYKFK